MAYRFDNISVLIVEDNQPMVNLIRSVLLTFGVHNIFCEKDGERGFQTFCEKSPDFIIADWRMQPVDGITLTREIRNSRLSPNPYVPVILITGFSEKDRVIEARDAGVTEFLVKPFNAQDLYKRLAQIIERPRQFVKSEKFFGPDRRRKRNQGYNGPFRRNTDVRPEDYTNQTAMKEEDE